METKLPAQADKNFDVAEVSSPEGGSWDVYYGPDSKTPRFVVRTDFGESGYWQSRLIVSSPRRLCDHRHDLHLLGAELHVRRHHHP